MCPTFFDRASQLLKGRFQPSHLGLQGTILTRQSSHLALYLRNAAIHPGLHFLHCLLQLSLLGRQQLTTLFTQEPADLGDIKCDRLHFNLFLLARQHLVQPSAPLALPRRRHEIISSIKVPITSRHWHRRPAEENGRLFVTPTTRHCLNDAQNRVIRNPQGLVNSPTSPRTAGGAGEAARLRAAAPQGTAARRKSAMTTR